MGILFSRVFVLKTEIDYLGVFSRFLKKVIPKHTKSSKVMYEASWTLME